MRIDVYPDADRLAQEVARSITVIAGQALIERRVSIGLAGGSTPAATYRCLAHEPVSWEGVDLWLSDERWVPADHPDSNGRMVAEILGSAPRLHRPRYTEFLTAIDSAAHYEALLRHLLGGRPPDLILLGMGTDGHTASLFPGTEALGVTDRHFVANYVEGMDVWRLTATFELIASARQVVVLAAGESKAEVLAEVVEGPPGRYPIQTVLAMDTDVRLAIDEAAASRLTRS